MPTKNSSVTINRISKALRLLTPIRIPPAAILFGGCFLLCGSNLTAQEVLLKEYIYFDGRLLAVERQIVALSGQQPAGNADRSTEMKLALHAPSQNPGITQSGSNSRTGVPAIQSALVERLLPIPVFTGTSAPEKDQNRFWGSDRFTVQLDSYRGRWNASVMDPHRNGGNDGGLQSY